MTAGRARTLDKIAATMPGAGDKSLSADYYLLRYGIKLLMPRLKGPRVLELGSAEGGMTRELARAFKRVTVVEGSAALLERARAHAGRAGNVEYVRSLFEDYAPQGKFDAIVMSRVLEHIEKPVPLLRRIRTWLAPRGRLHVIVPNAQALNRRIGKAMGMIKRLDELHARDRRVGHFRVYSRKTLAADLKAAGLTVSHWSGVFLKPLSDAQMQEWDPKLLDAFFEVGRELPEWCSELYAECRAS